MQIKEIESWLKAEETSIEAIRARWRKVVADDGRSMSELSDADRRDFSAKIVRFLLEQTQWREIDSAPRDGTAILLWAPDYFDDPQPTVGSWCDRVGVWSTDIATMEDGPATHADEASGPSHWRPLPLPPLPEKDNG